MINWPGIVHGKTAVPAAVPGRTMYYQITLRQDHLKAELLGRETTEETQLEIGRNDVNEAATVVAWCTVANSNATRRNARTIPVLPRQVRLNVLLDSRLVPVSAGTIPICLPDRCSDSLQAT